ncbi:SgcJ/EcaC family oxidoreductase [Peterkaempfera bronchialis]|uniref:SgcJ/EcaC family oxidoreductase n=1 Tax=Peterkaempfera bronchialis TaxID=2126346 RepID=A0A345T3C4_9ACTN|nr:SgcJ/EcaC family oxidoreductase [Peterkaempfera bronchialis]AXI80479.1 SgcJ/EcaC family oxidoreductase [Peterkaempfera bronchialis]
MGTDAAADRAVRELYRALLEGWDTRDAQAMAAPFAEDGEAIGFDGTRHCGRAGIAAELAEVFAGGPTPAYVAKVRGVRLLGPDAAVLQAVAGMVPPGESDLRPTLNARQTVVAARLGGAWRIVLFQSTPARFHGRPELRENLSEELRELLRPSYQDE